jgi:hypothetical protein
MVKLGNLVRVKNHELAGGITRKRVSHKEERCQATKTQKSYEAFQEEAF